jgi:aminopeptidase I
MTRHTPEFRRIRSSNLSLRASAMMDSAASLPLQSRGESRQEYVKQEEEPKMNVEAKDLDPAAFTKPYLDFMTAETTVFHATAYFKEAVEKAGYKQVREAATDSYR